MLALLSALHAVFTEPLRAFTEALADPSDNVPKARREALCCHRAAGVITAIRGRKEAP
jgi:hypothetical protein